VVRIVKSGLWDWIVVSLRESIRSQTGKMWCSTAVDWGDGSLAPRVAIATIINKKLPKLLFHTCKISEKWKPTHFAESTYSLRLAILRHLDQDEALAESFCGIELSRLNVDESKSSSTRLRDYVKNEFVLGEGKSKYVWAVKQRGTGSDKKTADVLKIISKRER
jgi:hypothetical protein